MCLTVSLCCLTIGAPFKLEAHLKFCPQNGTGCCDLDDDLQVQNQFEAMNTSNPECASLIKSILCAVSFLNPNYTLVPFFYSF